jgi:hypothetical protein
MSRTKPATPLRMNRSCQRQTHGLDTSARRMISAVPQPWAVARMIFARQTCFCELFRSATIRASPSRSAALTSMLIPSRMPQHATVASTRESYDCVRPLAGPPISAVFPFRLFMPNLLHSSRCPTGCEGGRNPFYLLPQGPSSQARRRCAQRHLAHDALLQRRPGQHPGARSGVPCTRPRGSARSASRSGTAGAGFSGSRPNDRVCSAPLRSASGRRTNRAIPRTTYGRSLRIAPGM